MGEARSSTLGTLSTRWSAASAFSKRFWSKGKNGYGEASHTSLHPSSLNCGPSMEREAPQVTWGQARAKHDTSLRPAGGGVGFALEKQVDMCLGHDFVRAGRVLVRPDDVRYSDKTQLFFHTPSLHAAAQNPWFEGKALATVRRIGVVPEDEAERASRTLEVKLNRSVLPYRRLSVPPRGHRWHPAVRLQLQPAAGSFRGR